MAPRGVLPSARTPASRSGAAPAYLCRVSHGPKSHRLPSLLMTGHEAKRQQEPQPDLRRAGGSASSLGPGAALTTDDWARFEARRQQEPRPDLRRAGGSASSSAVAPGAAPQVPPRWPGSPRVTGRGRFQGEHPRSAGVIAVCRHEGTEQVLLCEKHDGRGPCHHGAQPNARALPGAWRRRQLHETWCNTSGRRRRRRKYTNSTLT